ncbi:unnamed protein product [Cylicocyclus nassatus]|uniref:Uncharacterized protein n=1 Tax=Cylicocyclus nassatus TaxID=53992 RepID=A0AA36MCN3_CYLNA|nr:unnamed protein product [Cylicocyclus nassatus]
MSKYMKAFDGCKSVSRGMLYCVFIFFVAVPVFADKWTRCNIGYFLEDWVASFDKAIERRCKLRGKNLTMEYHCYQEYDAYKYTKGVNAKAGIEQNMFAALIRTTWSGRKLARLAVRHWVNKFGLCAVSLGISSK